MGSCNQLLGSAEEEQMAVIHVDSNTIGKARQGKGEWERGEARCWSSEELPTSTAIASGMLPKPTHYQGERGRKAEHLCMAKK